MAPPKKTWYRRNKAENLEEIEHIIILMTVSDEFLRFIAPLLSDLSILPQVSSMLKVIRWLVDFQKRNNQAPREYLQKIFEEKKDTLEEVEEGLIGKLLARLNEKYLTGDFDNITLQYELDKAEEYLQRQALKKNKEDIDAVLNSDVEEAVRVKESFILPSLSHASIGVNLIGDPQALERLDEKNETEGLFSLPGDLGFRAGPVYRGDLWAFLAAMKVGKTWWLSKVARIGVQKGLNVFFASLEMSMRKMVFRFTQPMTRMVKSQDRGRTVDFPYFNCSNNINGKRCRLKREEYMRIQACTFCSRSRDWRIRRNFDPLIGHEEIKLDKNPLLDIPNSIKALERFQKRNSVTGGGALYINSYPPRTTTVDEVYRDMKQIETYQGIKFDMFVSDYADNFRDQGEYRHQLHEIWSKHKGIGLTEKMAVFTASQSNTAREDGKRVTGGSWAEDIRKKGIIDVGIGLDADDWERKRQILTANIIANRDLAFNSKQLITVLNCYQIGKVHLGSWVIPSMQDEQKKKDS
jgi:hypothetical protein